MFGNEIDELKTREEKSERSQVRRLRAPEYRGAPNSHRAMTAFTSLLTSAQTRKELGSRHSCPYNNKITEQPENAQCPVHPAENGGYQANHHPKIWKDRQTQGVAAQVTLVQNPLEP